MRLPRRSSPRCASSWRAWVLKLPGAGSLQAGDFNRVLQRAKSMPVADLIKEIVLRSQSQAVYAAENLGHFGLHLRRYAHFTSPIRRYADLLVHRSLIRALGLGAGALADEEAARLGDITQAISDAERRAMAAERETTDRLIAAYSPTAWGQSSTRAFPGSRAPACSCACSTPEPTASCRRPRSATTTIAITRTATR
jgi:ribonuclease R